MNTWEGDQWKIGGGTTWGWYAIDPELNLIYYGTGNPSTWNPNQRPGDNRWSMTLFARDIDTGMAKWVYQMTPHDEWDYDGVNENILVDMEVDGEMRKALVHFDRNGFAYTMDRETGELLVAEKYDPAVNWATEVDMETGRPQVVDALLDRTQRRGREHHRHLPGGARHQGSAAGGVLAAAPACSTCRPTTSAWTTSRSRSRTPQARPMSARRSPCTRRRAAPTSATSSPGMRTRVRSSGATPSRSRSGRALWRPPATWSSTARSRAI